MQFLETPIVGGYLIDLDPRGDERGFFARTFCAKEFRAIGLETNFVQSNASYSKLSGTLRGLHYQLSPSSEAKLVRCTRGALWDVMLDLRRESPSFGKWFGAELTAENRRSLYVPEGAAHGFVTLQNDTEISYLVSAYYDSALERGVRWDDPKFAIHWPVVPQIISPRDMKHPDFVSDDA